MQTSGRGNFKAVECKQKPGRKRMYLDFKKQKKFIVIVLGHAFFSIICSLFFFGKIVADAGIENKAYTYFASGATLAEDRLSRVFCIVASYILAVGLIYLFWRFCFCLFLELKKKHSLAYLFLAVVLLGVFLVLCIYPDMFGMETTDDYMNYAYAKELLPMYWHGFFTNVVYCACMIFIPHPVAIPLIQFLFGISILFYLGNTFMTHVSGKKRYQIVLAFGLGFMVFLLPETINILFCPTRNCMYAILSLGMLAILVTDYLNKKELTKQKFVLLSCLFAIAGSWRGEGMLYLLAFPFLLYATYLSGRSIMPSKWKEKTFRQHTLWAMTFYVLLCVLFQLPDKYGAAKYQNSDYMIANTTGPLSAVFHNEKAQLSYEGAALDMERIHNIIPIEYIYKYGCNGGFFYNAEEGRWVRQSGASKKEGKEYVSAAYRILLHNLPDYLKYQWNLFLDANSIKDFHFSVDFGKENMENALELEPYVRAFELYDAGLEDLKKKDFTFLHGKVENIGKKLFEIITTKKAYKNGSSGMAKVFLIGIIVLTALIALLRRNYQYFLIAALNLALLAVIILMAPWSRPNYYYSVFFHMYWCLLYYLTDWLEGKL